MGLASINKSTPAVWWLGCPRASLVGGVPKPRHYRRIPLVDPEDTGYSALLALWPAGHTMPIHDRDGLLGIKLVLDGVLDVSTFQLTASPQIQPAKREIALLGISDHANFRSDDYVLRRRNISVHRSTQSLHVYVGKQKHLHFFSQHSRGHCVTDIHLTACENTLT